MYILIGGGGQVGYYLAKALLQDQEHEVFLAEKSADRVAQLKEELGEGVVGQGDACEVRNLISFGVERADMVIAVTGEDEDNLVICQVAKAAFHVKSTIARVNNPQNEALFKRLGIDFTVSPTQAIMAMIETHVPHHNKVVPLMTLTRAGLGLVELTVSQESVAVGKTIKDLRLPKAVNIVLIVRGDANVTPEGETRIEADDHIFALVTAEGEATLRHLILNETGVPS